MSLQGFIIASLVFPSFLSLLISDSTLILDLKNTVEIVEKIITIGAILVGGLWTYWIFIKNRQRYPRAKVINNAYQLVASGKSNILRVNLIVRNIGNVLIQIDEISIVVSQIEPIPEGVVSQIRRKEESIPNGQTEYAWDQIAGRSMKYDYHENEIEPGESQSYQFDFRLAKNVKKVEIYSAVNNITKPSKHLAWDCTTIFDIE